VMLTLRRCSPILIVVVLAAAVAACSSSASTSSSASSPQSATTTATASSGSDPTTASTTVTSPEPVSARATVLDVSKLAAAGIGVYADPYQAAPIHEVTTFDGAPMPVRLLATQARAMTLEAADGQGLLGSTIDQLIGVDPGMPPPSFLVAGWITGSQSPGAMYAHSLMGAQTWPNAPTIVFPTLVLALYAADAAQFADTLTATDTPTPGAPTSDIGSLVQSGFRSNGVVIDVAAMHTASAVGICSKVQGFVDSTISALFNSIGHLEQPRPPAPAHSAFGWFVAGLTAGYGYAVGVVNALIDAAHFLVVKLIGLLTQPVLGYIAKIAGVLGVVAQVVSFLRPWTIRMDDTPPSTRKAIGTEPGLPGTVTARVDLGGLDEWPTDITDCAMQAGVTLPPLKPVGAPIVWTMTQSDDLAVQSAGQVTVLDETGSAPFRYATTQESVETSKGDPVEGELKIQASIRRNAVADLQQTIANLVFAQIPSLIRPILQAVLAPVVTLVLDKVAALLDTSGYTQIFVSYHTPNTTTTTSQPVATSLDPTPVGRAPVDPCSVITEQEAATALGFDPGAGRENPFGNPADCGYVLEHNSPGIVLVDARTGPPLGGQAGFQRMEAQNKASGYPFQVVTGIGDGAFARQNLTGGPEGGPFASIVFYKGTVTITITVAFDSKGTAIPTGQAQTLAVAAAGRL
jgi:hypothetical protein